MTKCASKCKLIFSLTIAYSHKKEKFTLKIPEHKTRIRFRFNSNTREISAYRESYGVLLACKLPHLEDLHELGHNIREGDKVVGEVSLQGRGGGGGGGGHVGALFKAQLAQTRDVSPGDSGS